MSDLQHMHEVSFRIESKVKVYLVSLETIK